MGPQQRQLYWEVTGRDGGGSGSGGLETVKFVLPVQMCNFERP